MENPRYRIRDWSKHFENNRTRDMKYMQWVPVPNRMDGAGYTELVDHPDGAAHLGGWLAMVEIASKQEVRGTIPHKGAGIPQVLARMSRLPAGLFEKLIPRLLAIGWLEEYQAVTDIPQEGAEKPQDHAGIPQEGAPRARVIHGTERNGRERNGTELAGATSAPDRFTEWWAVWHSIRGTNHRDAAMRAWLSVVTAENADECCQCTLSYLQSLDNPAKGYNPENFLFDQARDNFHARWPTHQDRSAAKRAKEQATFQRRLLREVLPSKGQIA